MKQRGTFDRRPFLSCCVLFDLVPHTLFWKKKKKNTMQDMLTSVRRYNSLKFVCTLGQDIVKEKKVFYRLYELNKNGPSRGFGECDGGPSKELQHDMKIFTGIPGGSKEQ